MESLARTANRGSVSTGPYQIDNSCKFEADNTEKIQSAESDAGNRRTWTFSIWCKRTELGSGNFALWSHGDSFIGFEADKLMVSLQYSGSSDFRFKTNRLFRDTAAFYHIVVAVDTTQGTDTNRLKIYVNGVQETSFSSTGAGYPSQNFDTGFVIGSDTDHPIGNSADGAAGFCGYLSEILFIDTLQKAPTDFGEFDDDSGIWIPKKYSGAFSGRSFWYEFKNSGSMGTDSSGNSHTGLLNNIAAADQAADTPTNNFTTFNTLRRYNQDWVSFKEGATNVMTGSGNNWTTIFNTMAVNKGKWYFEGELYSNEITQMFGQQPQAFTEQNVNTDWYLGAAADKTKGAAYYGSGDDVYYEGTYANSSASTGGDIISVAMDCDNNKVHFAVNGSWTNSSDPANNTNGFAMLDDYQYFATALFPGSATWKYNFGGYTTISISSAASDANGYGTFEYAPPSGFYAMCTKNLAEYG